MIPRFPGGFSHPVQIGIGGFGTVYRARQDALDRLVALKFIAEKSTTVRAELIKEATMQAGVVLQGIPQVYDVREVAGNVCIVMQWIRGCSLREIIENRAAYGYEYIIALEILRIIASLHERDYAHRDIKPENIIISAEGISFIDFGLARHLVKDPRQTMANVVKGTPEYIAPELWKGQGRTADLKRADVYSTGKVIKELYGDIPMPQVIAECLATAPEARPASAVEILRRWKVDNKEYAVQWSDITEPYTSVNLSGQLYRAAQTLLNVRRTEEAYDLLVECLQVYPEYPGALELMDRFPLILRERSTLSRFKFAGSVIGVLILCVVLSFFFFHDTNDNRNEASRYLQDTRSLFITSPRSEINGIDRTLPFKEVTGSFRKLRGSLVLAPYPEIGTLFIDGKSVTVKPDTLYVSARNDIHHLVWRAANGSIIWKEVVTTYPFEIKRLYIRER